MRPPSTNKNFFFLILQRTTSDFGCKVWNILEISLLYISFLKMAISIICWTDFDWLRCFDFLFFSPMRFRLVKCCFPCWNSRAKWRAPLSSPKSERFMGMSILMQNWRKCSGYVFLLTFHTRTHAHTYTHTHTHTHTYCQNGTFVWDKCQEMSCFYFYSLNMIHLTSF